MIERADAADGMQQQGIDLVRDECALADDGHDGRMPDEVLIDELVVELSADLLYGRQRSGQRVRCGLRIGRGDADAATWLSRGDCEDKNDAQSSIVGHAECVLVLLIVRRHPGDGQRAVRVQQVGHRGRTEQTGLACARRGRTARRRSRQWQGDRLQIRRNVALREVLG